MEYILDSVSIDEVKEEANSTLSALKSDADLRRQAEVRGINLGDLDKILGSNRPEELIEVQPSKSGLDPITTAVVVAFAPTAAKITYDIWREMILPRIRKKHGPDSVKPVDSDKE